MGKGITVCIRHLRIVPRSSRHRSNVYFQIKMAFLRAFRVPFFFGINLGKGARACCNASVDRHICQSWKS
ncbi:hypothetical protein D3C86_2222780 [compost metagenome]